MAENFRDLDTTEINNKLTESQEQMFRLRFQIKMGQSEGLKKFRELKKDRARMLGVLRERELQGKGK
jgi:large subunit ribosomal protein L29